MSKNPGNTGHRGYKMSRVTAIQAIDGQIVMTLECGHDNRFYPYSGYTAEEWVQRLHGCAATKATNNACLLKIM